jgi:hypothetical protein
VVVAGELASSLLGAAHPLSRLRHVMLQKSFGQTEELGSQEPLRAVPIETHRHYVLIGRCLPPLFSAALGSEWVQAPAIQPRMVVSHRLNERTGSPLPSLYSTRSPIMRSPVSFQQVIEITDSANYRIKPSCHLPTNGRHGAADGG